MQAVTITQISPPELVALIHDVVKKALEVSKPNAPDNQPELISIDEVAELLHLTKPTVYSKHSRKELPGVCKRGKRLFFHRQTIIDWIKSGRKESNAEILAKIEAHNAELINEADQYLSNNKKRLNDGK
jgi:excisionase family DNA binding protein